jgi:trk system potassium uptake protein TrkH
LGTVGLSMSITGELSAPGKVIIILLMFVGRCGPLTLGLALLEPRRDAHGRLPDDLAV